MTNRPIYTDEQFRQAIPGSGGIITTIAERVGCSWHKASRHIKGNDELRELYEHEANKIDDLAESIVIRAIKDGDVATAKWFLERRRRGTYATRTEVSADVSGVVAIGLRSVDYRTDIAVIAADAPIVEDDRKDYSSQRAGKPRLVQGNAPPETIDRYDGAGGRESFGRMTGDDDESAE